MSETDRLLQSLPTPEAIRARLAILIREQQILRSALRIAERARKNRELDAESRSAATAGGAR
jgi:hypothetical protein